MTVAVLIQARIASKRLPRKIMAEISGKPMLWHVINRVKQAENIDEIILITTKNIEDNLTVEVAESCGVNTFRGSEKDVLDRFYRAAIKYDINVIVRVTADCPVIDPQIIDTMVNYYMKHPDLDCVGMGDPNPCPDGLDTELFTFKSLKTAFKDAKLESEREHVTPYLWKHPDKFKIEYMFKAKKNLAKYRWTVDEESDLKFIREIYKRLYKKGEIFHTKDILELLSRNPELMEINSGIVRNEGYIKSLKEDKILR